MIRPTAALLPALLVLLSPPASAAPQRPNVLVILTDDQGWGDIGYNNPRVYTPNLDRLAAGSAKLTQHYVMPQCTPTRLALFTGRYPGRFGVSGLQATNRPLLPRGTTTLATMLKAAGYETFLTGKWHMGSQAEHGPNHHGFDYSYGALAGAVGAYVHLYREGHPYAETWHRNHQPLPGHENGRHVTDLVTDDAIRVIKQSRDAPFFLYLPYFAPHTPLDERGDRTEFPTQLDGDNPTRWLREAEIEWFNDPLGVIQQEPDAEKRLFLAVLHHLDAAIGRVIAALEETGQRRNTIIFFTSDNGPQVNWHGGAYPSDLRLTDFNQPTAFRGSKLDVWEGGVRTPTFVNWPGKIAPQTIDSPVHVVDWLPTIASVVGADATAPDGQPAIDGRDFSQRLLSGAGQGKPGPRTIYLTHGQKTDKWALRFGGWKIVHYGAEEPALSDWELYHLADDSGESKNVASSHPAKIRELHRLFLTERAKDKPGHNFPDYHGPN